FSSFAANCLARSGVLYLGADTNFHVNVRPAALETAAAVSASIVDLCAQNVFTGHAEGGGRRHFAVRVHFGFGVGEGYGAGSAELAPRDRCRWVVVGSCFGRTQSIIG